MDERLDRGRSGRRRMAVGALVVLIGAGLAAPAPASSDLVSRARQAGPSGPEVVIRGAVFRPFGAAVDGAGNLFVSDSAHRVLKKAPDGSVTVLGFTGLDAASGVAVGDDGAVYVAAGSRVARLGADGTQSDVATGLQKAVGVAVGGDGTLYVVDETAKQVLAVPPGGGSASTLPFDALGQPTGVAVGDDDTVYVTDRSAKLVLALAAGGAAPTPVPFTALDEPLAVAVDAAGTVYVTDGHGSEVGDVIKLPSGGPQAALPIQAGIPHGVAVAADGTVYIAGPNDEIRAGPSDGRIAKLAPGATDDEDVDFGGISFSRGVAVAPDGTTFASDCNPYGPCYLGTATPDQDIAPFPTSEEVMPGNLTFDDEGTLYTGGRNVTMIAPDGTVERMRIKGLAAVGSIAVAPDGTIYASGDLFGYGIDQRIIRLAPDGTRTVLVESRQSFGSLTLAPDGTLFFITRNGDYHEEVHAIEPDGSTRVVPVEGVERPEALAMDPGGNLYVGGRDEAYATFSLVQVQPSGTEVPVPSGAFGIVPQITVAGSFIYLADQADGVWRIPFSGIATAPPPVDGPPEAAPATPIQGPASFTG